MITKIDKQRMICKLNQDILLKELQKDDPNLFIIENLTAANNNSHSLLEWMLTSQAKADCMNYES